jgi:hypothetical protein
MSSAQIRCPVLCEAYSYRTEDQEHCQAADRRRHDEGTSSSHSPQGRESGRSRGERIGPAMPTLAAMCLWPRTATRSIGYRLPEARPRRCPTRWQHCRQTQIHTKRSLRGAA